MVQSYEFLDSHSDRSEQVNEVMVAEHHGRRAKSLFKYGLEYISQCLLNHTNRYRIDIFKFFVICLVLIYERGSSLSQTAQRNVLTVYDELPSVCLPVVAVSIPLPTFAGMAADLTKREKLTGEGV